MATVPDPRSVEEIYSSHPLAAILIDALDTEPSPATSVEFQKGFYAAREIIRLQGAAVLSNYAVKELEPTPLERAFSGFSEGGELSMESRQEGDDFQQRPVLRGEWKSVDKPSGLS